MRCPHCSKPLALLEWSAGAPGEGTGIMQCRNPWCSASFQVRRSVWRLLEGRTGDRAKAYDHQRLVKNVTCPTCGGPTAIRTSRHLTSTAAEEYAECITQSCARRFVAIKVLDAEISPSARPKVRLPAYQPPAREETATTPEHATDCTEIRPVENRRIQIIRAIDRIVNA